ncbi:MAG: ATP-binding protein [Desulfuromonadales bacterium]|nr:ATP-binding protein [Desulfuromonadales bacterium]
MGLNLPLRFKLLFLTLSVVVCFGVAIGFYVTARVTGDLSNELLKRGVSIARHIAEISAEDFIEHNHLHLQYLAREHQTAEADIRYILMIDRDGELLAHSFGATFPAGLAKLNRYGSGEDAVIKRLDAGSEVIYDIAVPVLDGRIGGLRIGISAEPISTAVNTLIREILVAILLIGILAFALTLPAAQAIARPLTSLTRAINGLSKGRRDLQLPVDRRDEIGVLNDAFNQMATDVRQVEKRLAAQVHFLQVLMADLPVPVFYKDQTGRMLGCNRAFADFWGKQIDEIVGRSAAELYPPEDASLHLGKDAEVLGEGQPVVYEHAVTGADGKQYAIVFHKALFRDEEGQPAGIVGVMHDVTLQRESARMKSDFVSTVAHEFQTPLATILGFSELLQDNTLEESDRAEALKTIMRKSEALSQMVDELLDLARLESGRQMTMDKADCNLVELLDETIGGFRKRMTTHLFHFEAPATPLVIQADGQRLTQVVENLLSNAVKYSDAGSAIHVSTGLNGKRCHIVIRDEGVGMSPEQIEHVFDKFYRANATSSAPVGTGLGLFIVKSIVDAHHGEIHINSVLGQGTTVTISLPLKAEGRIEEQLPGR